MVYSINDKIREKLFKNKSVNDTLSFFNNLSEESKISVLKLLLLDYVKVMAIELEDVNSVKRLPIFKYPIEYTINLCLSSTNYLIDFLQKSFAFYSSELVNKSITIELMEIFGMEDLLFEMSNLYALDKMSYTFSYELEDFKLYFLDSIEKNINCGGDISLTIDFLKYKLKDINECHDFKKYESYILELVREYYKWNLFKKEGLNIDPKFPDNYEYLDMVKKYPFYSLVSNSIYDDEFLTTILFNYLHYSIFADKTIEKEANKYLIDNSDEQLQKKLKIKRD